MSLVSAAPLFTARNSRSGYEIDQSLRFDGSSYLSRTPSSAGNRNTWTSSYWFKKAPAETSSAMHTWSSTQFTAATFNGGSTSTLTGGTNAATVFNTTAKYRDSSAWMHIVVRYDSTQSGGNKYRIYLNGEEYTGPWLTDARSGLGTGSMNNTVAHYIGNSAIHGGTTFAFQGYMAEFHHIDGTSLEPTNFGEYDDNGVWRPISVSGLTYSTNGFYLTFDPSATNGIGHDHSGNGNNFSPTGFTTSGTGTDVMSDTPTTNWCTLNPNDSFQQTVSNGNLVSSNTNNVTTPGIRASMAMPSGKWYWEITCGVFTSASTWMIGVADTYEKISIANYTSSGSYLYYSGNGDKYNGSSHSSYGATYTTGDVIGVAYDADNGKIWFAKNNTWQNSGDPAAGTGEAYSGITGDKSPYVGTGLYQVESFWNFGQRAFAYTPPTGYKELNTANLPEPDIKDGSGNFNTVLYTGNGSTQSITGVGLQPDFVWVKKYNSSGGHHTLTDAVRGSNKQLWSNRTAGEQTSSLFLTSFDSDGFSVGDSSVGFGNVNTNGDSFAAWCWKAGNGTSSNTSGSITSTVSANPSAGFSIVSYTGTGANATVGHGLGVAPSLLIIKNRGVTDWNWRVWHKQLSASEVLWLNTTDSVQTGQATMWNNTLPSSTVFSLGTNSGVNESLTNHVAYCFAEVEGYSKFGSYVGNGSTDGPFVFLGFRPAALLWKKSSGTSNWLLWDVKRDTYNAADSILKPNSTDGEETDSVFNFDLLSNGFKVRTGSATINDNGATYIFAAFAEHPTGGSGVSPATAR